MFDPFFCSVRCSGSESILDFIVSSGRIPNGCILERRCSAQDDRYATYRDVVVDMPVLLNDSDPDESPRLLRLLSELLIGLAGVILDVDQ